MASYAGLLVPPGGIKISDDPPGSDPFREANARYLASITPHVLYVDDQQVVVDQHGLAALRQYDYGYPLPDSKYDGFVWKSQWTRYCSEAERFVGYHIREYVQEEVTGRHAGDPAYAQFRIVTKRLRVTRVGPGSSLGW